MVVLVATSLAFDTTFLSILSVNPALAGLSLVLLAPDLAVGELGFFVTELLVFAVVFSVISFRVTSLRVTLLRVAFSAAGAELVTDLAVAVFLARDFTTGLGLGLATLDAALLAVATGDSDFSGTLVEIFAAFSAIFALLVATLTAPLSALLPALLAGVLAGRVFGVNLPSDAAAFLATAFLTVRFMVLSLKSAARRRCDWPAIQ
ncbi:hypothetical protein [Collimonas sp. OK307]|uniref:hypothetical protein n=1 Tax=Collimonas sp. OK307 TaxID=1801620 RepID=UPI000B87634E|nr:hypothetical protein [Collimonas sp. OK307]